MTLTPADLLKSLAAGYLSGLILSLPFPVGPVNLTVINQALRKGFLSAFLVGLGAVLAETIYAGTMLAGHLVILDLPYVRLGFHLAAIGLIAGMGLRSVRFREEQAEVHDADIATKVESRWHHPRSFILGFVLNISNLMLLVIWATAATVLSEHDWVTSARASRWTCAVGVLAGGATWFAVLAFLVSRAHRRVRPAVLTYLVRCGGVAVLVLALLLAYKLF